MVSDNKRAHGARPTNERSSLLQKTNNAHNSHATVLNASSTVALDQASLNRLVRKIDLRLLPILLVTFGFAFIDKTTLSSASVYGLTNDIDLSGNKFAWVASIFYTGYFLWEYPTTILIQKLPVGKYVGTNILLWGIVVGATASCTSFAELMIVRALVGVIEAAISPSFVYIISMWYTRKEIPCRMGILYAGNSIGGAFAHIFSWSIGHIERHFSPWRWMYLIIGVSTTIWSVLVLFTLPDTIQTANFLDSDEKDLAESRISAATTGISSSSKGNWDLKEALECLIDPKTWFFFTTAFLNQVPNGGFQLFGNLIIKGFGFTSFESSLTSIPISFVTIFVIIGSGILATRHRNITTLLVSGLLIPSFLGFVLINRIDLRILNLFCYYMMSFSHGVLPLISSLVAANIRSVTQKMTMMALMLIAFCAGNIIGPQLFRETDAPRYRAAFDWIALSYALAFLSSLGLRFYLMSANKAWDEEERLEAESSEVVPPVESLTKGFRYRL